MRSGSSSCGSAGCARTGDTREETDPRRLLDGLLPLPWNPGLAPVPLGESLAHPLYLSLQFLQVRFELSHPLLPVAEAPMEAVGTLPASARAATMAAVTGAGTPTALVVTSVAAAAAATIL